MPIYEYCCADCGFQEEFLQKMGAAPLTDCPTCGKASLKKMVTAAGFQLKGSGWYATDFKHGPKPKSKPEDRAATKSEDPSAAKPQDPSAAKPEDKPAAKPEAKPASEATATKSDTATSSATSGTRANPVST